MTVRLALALTAGLALAAPGAVMAKEKDKDKDKHKGKKAKQVHSQTVDGRHADRDHDRDDDRDGRGRGRDDDGNGRVTICHIPPGNSSARKTITIGESAWDAHRRHGDHRGACGGRGDDDGHGGDATRRFHELDRNDDLVIVLREWPGDRATFERIDTSDDNAINLNEFIAYRNRR
jgi:hypothetical protein